MNEGEKIPELIEDLRFLTPPVPEAWWVTYRPWLIVAAVLLAMAVAAFMIRLRRRRLRAAAAALAGQDLTPPHVRALQALAELEALIKAGGEREFTQRVSDVVRIYIQDRFGLRAPHRSTEEFLFEAAQSGKLTEGDQRRLADFLGECDMVKFAKRELVVDVMRTMLDAARKFVEGTAAEDAPAATAVATGRRAVSIAKYVAWAPRPSL